MPDGFFILTLQNKGKICRFIGYFADGVLTYFECYVNIFMQSITDLFLGGKEMDALYNLAKNIIDYCRQFLDNGILDIIQDFFNKIFKK